MTLNASYCSASYANTLFFKANILIDQNGHACLADFGLLTIISDPASFTAPSSPEVAGTVRWMSPELLSPDQPCPEDSRPTKASDCYALGMVIYEVLSGQMPFPRFHHLIVMQKVIRGERPGRPEGVKGAWFTDDLWGMLDRCWATQPGARPNIEAVLESLPDIPRDWKPPSPQATEDVESQDYWDLTIVSDPSGMAPCHNHITSCYCGGFHIDHLPHLP